MSEFWFSNRTQIAWTCYALALGRTISTPDEIGEVRGWRLGAIVHVLRTKYGWPIVTEYRGPDRIGHYRLKEPYNVLTLRFPPSAKEVRDEVKAILSVDDATGSDDG